MRRYKSKDYNVIAKSKTHEAIEKTIDNAYRYEYIDKKTKNMDMAIESTEKLSREEIREQLEKIGKNYIIV